jgi:hypothetical protein
VHTRACFSPADNNEYKRERAPAARHRKDESAGGAEVCGSPATVENVFPARGATIALVAGEENFRDTAVHGYPLAQFILGFPQSRQNCRIAAVLASKCLPRVNQLSLRARGVLDASEGIWLVVHP